MAEKYEINVSVSSRSGGGGGGSRSQAIHKEAAATARTRVRESNAKPPGGRAAAEGGGLSAIKGLLSQFKPLERAMTSLKGPIDKLRQTLESLKKMTAGGGRIAGGLAGSTMRATGAGSFASAAGLGNIGSSLPIAGALIGAAGYIIHKVQEIGQRYLEVAGEQKETAGVGGFQFGQEGYRAAEVGQYAKARAEQTGQWGTAVGTGGAESQVLQFGRTFGIGAGEMGKYAGLVGATSGKSGDEGLSRVLNSAISGGMRAQSQQLLSFIGDTLTDAVTSGVNDSDLAAEIAAGTADSMKYRTNQNLGPLLAVSRALTQMQMGSMQKGNVSNFAEYKMREIAIEKMKAPENQKEVEGMIEKLGGGMTVEEAMKDPNVMQSLVAQYVAAHPDAVQKEYEKGVYAGIPGQSAASRTAAAQSMFQAQGVDITEGQNRALAEEIRNREKGKVVSGKKEEDEKRAFQSRRDNPAMMAAENLIQMETALLRNGAEAARTVVAMNQSLINLATMAAPHANEQLVKMNQIMSDINAGNFTSVAKIALENAAKFSAAGLLYQGGKALGGAAVDAVKGFYGGR